MTNPRSTFLSSIAASLFAAAMLVGCGAPVESGEHGEEGFDDEVAETDDAVGESEEALRPANPTGGGGCGYFCPWWAKDLSDCLMIPCDDAVASP
ncbi:MAG: hypothetical protein WKG00_27900 [Polyangiaceae bacterium]